MGTAVLLPAQTAVKEVGPYGRKIHQTLKAVPLAAAFGVNPNLKREPDVIYPYHSADSNGGTQIPIPVGDSDW